ncbi:MAG: hypothetical protein KGJ00_23605, partial [Bradyrhizobium sp.]|nr:hypothetical protein [Bradyrhizobium sp.]
MQMLNSCFAGRTKNDRGSAACHGRLRCLQHATGQVRRMRSRAAHPDANHKSNPSPDPRQILIEGRTELTAHLGLLERDVHPVYGRKKR